MGLVRRSIEILREDGLHEFIDRAAWHLKYRVPGPLSPLYPYIVVFDSDDIGRIADREIVTQEPQRAEIKYRGDLEDERPPFLDNEDWYDENRGRVVYQFSGADIIGSPPGVLRQNRYRPAQAGAPSTIRVGRQFIAPLAIGTYTQRSQESLEHLDTCLGSAGLLRHWTSGAGPDREFDTAFLLSNPYGQAYGAFQSDLFKLRAFEAYRRMTGEDPRLIVPAGPAELVQEYLSLVGYGPGSYVTLDHETIRVRRLLVPSQRPRKGNGEIQPSPSDRPWLRDRILSTIDCPETPSNERIYVSRQDERRRRVVNFEEIRPILEKHSFRVYNPGNHSLRDQIRTFARANVFVGPHGSGMLNSMFATDGSVVELLSTTHWRTSTVFIVAQDMGFDYGICPCEPVSDSHDVTRHQDIVVDPHRFEDVIERTIESRASPEQFP